jgi:FixJ family two-component response regulator
MTSPAKQEPAPCAYVVDDDEHMRVAVIDVLRSYDVHSRAFETAADFLASVPPNSVGCIVLDVQLPDINGLQLQEELSTRGNKMPIVFITGYGDIPMTVQAMQAGAIDFLTKPFNDDDLMKAVSSAFDKDARRRAKDAVVDDVIALARSLTRREWQVFAHVVNGLMNKQIAYELSLTEITVKLHRASLMKKLHSRTLPDLVRKAEMLNLRGRDDETTPQYSSGNAAGGVVHRDA